MAGPWWAASLGRPSSLGRGRVPLGGRLGCREARWSSCAPAAPQGPSVGARRVKKNDHRLVGERGEKLQRNYCFFSPFLSVSVLVLLGVSWASWEVLLSKSLSMDGQGVFFRRPDRGADQFWTGQASSGSVPNQKKYRTTPFLREAQFRDLATEGPSWWPETEAAGEISIDKPARSSNGASGTMVFAF